MNKGGLIVKDAIIVSLALLSWAVYAKAADPECTNVTEAPCAQRYDAISRGGIEFCTPELDETGQPLVSGELQRCLVRIGGSVYATVQTTTPGSFFDIPLPTSGPKQGTFDVVCEGVAGQGAPTCTYQTDLRRAKPGKQVVR